MTPDEQVALANRLMRLADAESPAGMGITLLVYPHSKPGMVTYISNSERADMVKSLRALLTKWEQEGTR